jgi:hypothetical protein
VTRRTAVLVVAAFAIVGVVAWSLSQGGGRRSTRLPDMTERAVVTPLVVGRLRVRVDKPDADVTVEGVAGTETAGRRASGKTGVHGLFETTLPPGRYRVKASLGAETATADVDVSADGGAEVELRLR